MKKIAIFWYIFFMFFSQLNANENPSEIENINLQIFRFNNTKQEITFLSLNPLFFSINNKNFLMNIYENNRIQPLNTNYSQENSAIGTYYSVLLFAASFFAPPDTVIQKYLSNDYLLNDPYHETKMRQEIFNYYNKNFNEKK